MKRREFEKSSILMALVLGMIGTFTVSGCGSSESADKPSTDSSALSWDTDVKTIVANSCGGSGCHDAAKSPASTVYVGQEAAFKASASADRISRDSTAAGYMPLKSSTTLSAADKEKLLTFLAQ